MFYHDTWVTLSGIKLFVRKIHREKKINAGSPVIVFLHEGLGSVEQWKDFPEKLVSATGLDAVVYDRLGYGKSGPLTEKRGIDYIHKEEKFLHNLIEALNLNSYFVVGHSEGGSLGLIHASNHPKDLLKVVTLSANSFNEPKIAPSIEEVIKTYEAPQSKLKIALTKYHGEKTDDVFYAWSKTWTAPFFHSWNILDELTKIEVPVQSFHGKNDQYTSLQQIENIKRLVTAPKEIIILDDCSHHPHFDHQDVVVKNITDFLSQA
ncbi:MAG: alpha/beta hydrolase [Bacteroidales bacterium]|nr:alpha/beta hydrolase [Bacteroidales bacterium]